jgi:hypothetical protein
MFKPPVFENRFYRPHILWPDQQVDIPELSVTYATISHLG